MKSVVNTLLNNTNASCGKWFAYMSHLIVIFSLFTFSLGTLPNLTESQYNTLYTLECMAIGFFTLEYIARLWVSEKTLGYAFSFYGVVDFVAIVPFYLTVGLDLRAVLILRMFRILRLLKLARYNKALERLVKAAKSITGELIIFAAISAALIFITSAGIYYLEREAQPDTFGNIFDSLWWAVVSLTTIGYGDAYPVTVGGRVFASIVFVLGLGVVTIPTGLFTAALFKDNS
ncbi:ion transporter [Vibrio breoganii]|uniref:ion transporter n=1 Tax=Vibrio breoganii TaxID=553239 RepID=UPI0002D95DAE|nr:ion transporter [Vibrio breoganii]OED97944.1 voltage-gated potassium channel [Vibrio breoganii ZF-29]PMG91326.1 voltage-gated potassium channel [Vibrio breoganii]PML36321.1 voltage-gated potassium channel [Vibrio breoganii]PMM87464.1 voltage-gated potassium channel [Vibrio breoganii]PMO29644.1 voltage-gated potassium channel [Vibrio breoganii]